MADILLPQEIADHLLSLDKIKSNNDTYEFPDDSGGKLIIPLVSKESQEEFHLDVWRGGINLKKGRYQNRGRKTIILARIDFEGAPHRNPDDEEISCPHLHVYREGYGDKWAYPLPESFQDHDNKWNLFQDFLRYCNIVEPPDFRRGLFG